MQRCQNSLNNYSSIQKLLDDCPRCRNNVEITSCLCFQNHQTDPVSITCDLYGGCKVLPYIWWIRNLPCSWHVQNRTQVPGVRCLVPGTGYQVPGTRYTVPASRYLIPSNYLVRGARYSGNTWYYLYQIVVTVICYQVMVTVSVWGSLWNGFRKYTNL